MSSSGSGSTASFSSGNAQQAPSANQQQQPQQPGAMFDRGRDLFERLRANKAQEVKNFKKLGDD